MHGRHLASVAGLLANAHHHAPAPYCARVEEEEGGGGGRDCNLTAIIIAIGMVPPCRKRLARWMETIGRRSAQLRLQPRRLCAVLALLQLPHGSCRAEPCRRGASHPHPPLRARIVPHDQAGRLTAPACIFCGVAATRENAAFHDQGADGRAGRREPRARRNPEDYRGREQPHVCVCILRVHIACACCVQYMRGFARLCLAFLAC